MVKVAYRRLKGNDCFGDLDAKYARGPIHS